MEKITIQDSHCTLIEGIQFYSTRAPQKENSFKSNLAQISNNQGIIMYCFLFSFVRSRGMVVFKHLSFKRGKETSYL